METVKEKIKAAVEFTKATIKDKPEVTNLWFEFKEIDLDELREVAKELNCEVNFNEQRKCMRFLYSEITSVTIFCYSKPVEVRTHIVITDAIINK